MQDFALDLLAINDITGTTAENLRGPEEQLVVMHPRSLPDSACPVLGL
jgi:hypothetical protein